MVGQLREQAAVYGANTLSDEELLSLVLGSSARALLEHRPLHQLALVSSRELCAIDGIGPARAARLHAVLELGRRLAAPSPRRGVRFAKSADVGAYFMPRLAHLLQEELHLVLLDCRNRLIHLELIARGGLAGLSVHPREILAPALREGAAGLILVHNHPSGDATPSAADRELTSRVASGAKLLGLNLLDHVIVAASGFTSLMQ